MISSEVYEDAHVKCWIQDDILHGIYAKGVIVTLDVAKNIVAQRLKLQNGRTLPAIAYMSEIQTATPEARKYFAIEGYKGMTKLAMIIDSKMKVFILNIFISIDKPLKPTRIFTNKADAVKWLNEK